MNASIIRAMVQLRLRRVARDRTALVWLLVMPMVFSFLMGQLMGDWSGTGGAPKPRFSVFAGDRGAQVERLLADLRDHERFMVVVADTLVAPEDARREVQSGRSTAVLLVPADFGQGAVGRPDTLGLWYDSDRLSSQTVRTLLDRAVLKLDTERAARRLVSTAPAGAEVGADSARAFDQAAFDRHWQAPRVVLRPEVLGRRPEAAGLALTRASQHAGPAYTLFFVMMFLMTSAKDLVAERRDRTLARLAVSRASSLDLVLGFLAGGLVLGLLQAAVLLVLNGVCFGIDYGDSPAALVLAVVLFATVASAASVVLGSTARTGGQADGLGVATTLVLAALGGLWWPLEIVPPFMQAVGGALPSGEAITCFHGMIGRGWGLAELAGPLGGLAAWAVALVVLGTWRLRRVLRSG
ncbi:MAG TPA: ABC transporter permease [Candidatus Krumholzibacteria bacterium]|nr:ABC transporter permease [Candidatus Krumholzibacteria bacterium]